MKVLLINPDFYSPIIIKGNFSEIKEAINHFLNERQVDLPWFIEFKGDWEVYAKSSTEPHLLYYGTVAEVVTAVY